MLELSRQLKANGLEGQALKQHWKYLFRYGRSADRSKLLPGIAGGFQQTKKSVLAIERTLKPLVTLTTKLNMPDSAIFYEYGLTGIKQFPVDLLPELMCRLGNANVKLGKYKEALVYYKKRFGLCNARKDT